MLSMRNKRWGQPWCAAGVLAATLLMSPAVPMSHAQDDAAAAAVDPSELLKDYVHYVTIANFELARANATALLDLEMTPVEFVDLVEGSARMEERFEEAYRRSQRLPELESMGAALHKLYEDGRKARARNPQEIRDNIALLKENRRAQLLARDRIAAAGEYAVPQLLEIILARQDSMLTNQVEQVLVGMGRDAVAPLCAALLSLPPEAQETVARVLGRIGYRMALPYLYELAATSTESPVRAMAERAIRNIDGSFENAGNLGLRYRELGERYYGEPRSLTSFPGESHQLLWSFSPQIGLQPQAIRTEVFHEARAMELAGRAMTLDSSDWRALSLWLASNFSREIDQPEDYDNPAYPAERREAMYYAVAAGSGPVQEVLRRALSDRDTRLARRAIEALSRSASGVDLSEGFGDALPLVQALYYPDRRVQFESALAIGHTNPVTGFDGAERVVPLLASAIREASKRYAVVLAPSLDDQQRLRAMLEGTGFEVLPPAESLNDIAGAIAGVAGVDLIIAQQTPDTLMETISSVRADTGLAATPVLGVTSFQGLSRYGAQFENDDLTRLVRDGVSLGELSVGAGQLVEQAAGATVTEEEGRAYALACLEVLDALSLGCNGVLDVSDASLVLISALGETTGEIRLNVAGVLSRIGQQRAQVALMDAAIEASGDERIAMLEFVIESARQHGNLLEDRQIEELVDMADYGLDDEATVAAALIGALNLPREELTPLILNQ